MYTGHGPCCLLVSHIEYARRALLTSEKKRWDRQMDCRPISMLAGRCGKWNKVWLNVCWHAGKKGSELNVLTQTAWFESAVVNGGECLSVGGRASAISVEQWVPSESDWGEPVGCNADHVPGAVPCLEGALEPSNLDAGLQRPQDVHGDERFTLWRTHGQLQTWRSQVRLSFLLHNTLWTF